MSQDKIKKSHKKHLKRFYDELISRGVDMERKDLSIDFIDEFQGIYINNIRRDVSDEMAFELKFIKCLYPGGDSLLNRMFYLTVEGFKKVQYLFSKP